MPFHFNTLFKFLLLAVFVVLAGNLRANGVSTLPAQIAANYGIYKGGILIGTVEESFTSDGNSYKIVSETRTAGPLKLLLNDRVTLSSEGRIGSKGLAPSRYDLKRHNDSTKNVSAVFDFGRSRIVSIHHDKTETFDLPADTLDRITAMYQFAFVTPLAPEVSFWMSQGKEAELYHYRKLGEAVIRIGETAYSTVHYARQAEKGRPQVQLWLAKDHHHIPVRMIFEDSRGLSLEQTLLDLRMR